MKFGDSKDPTTQTLIDLGDDLLEKTLTSTVTSEPVPELNTPLHIDDQLQSARILLGEGLVDEAKRILHRVLVADPGSVVARQRLEEIQQNELKQIFTSDAPARSRRKSRPQPAQEPSHFDAEEILRDLDQDLRLGGYEAAAVPSLFKDAEGMQAFSERIDIEYLNASARDRMDLGIASLEMGLHELSMQQFRVAQRSSELALPATALLAFAMIVGGKAFEATLMLEIVLGDSEITPVDKIEFVYLMGRAHEELQRNEFAVRYYGEVLEADPTYRDTRERSLKCEIREKRALSKRP